MTTARDTQSFSSVIEEMKAHGMKLPSGKVFIAVPNAKEVLENAMRYFISLEGKQAVWLQEYDQVAEWLGDNQGRGIRIETEGHVSFSALRYTDEDLMNTQHTWELKPRPYIVLHLDAALRGTGNGSCGRDTGTISAYWVPQQELSYTLRIQPVK